MRDKNIWTPVFTGVTTSYEAIHSLERSISWLLHLKGLNLSQPRSSQSKAHAAQAIAPGIRFNISCWDTGGLCGFFYHDIFPNLNVMQFGGKYPWGSADEMVLECPDRENLVKIRIKRS